MHIGPFAEAQIADTAQHRSVELKVLPHTAQQPKSEQRQHCQHEAEIRQVIEHLQPTPEQAAANHLIAMQRRHHRQCQVTHRDWKPLSEVKKPETGMYMYDIGAQTCSTMSLRSLQAATIIA